MSKRLRVLLVSAVVVGVIIGAVIAPLHAGPKGGPSIDDYQSGLVAALASAALFITVYSVRERWWSDWIGRFIVSHVLAFAFVCLPFILALFFKLNRVDNEVAGWVLLGSFYASAAVLLLGTILWLHTSIENARKRREREAAEAGHSEGPE